jgi:hypothetical protein
MTAMETDADLQAVGRSYRTVRETGAMGYPAVVAARQAYLTLKPEAVADPAQSEIGDRLIGDACNLGLVWADVQWRRRQ